MIAASSMAHRALPGLRVSVTAMSQVATYWVDGHGALGRVFAARAVSRTHEDAAEHLVSTSQAEYAGSIPVIGSTFDPLRRCRTPV